MASSSNGHGSPKYASDSSGSIEVTKAVPGKDSAKMSSSLKKESIDKSVEEALSVEEASVEEESVEAKSGGINDSSVSSDKSNVDNSGEEESVEEETAEDAVEDSNTVCHDFVCVACGNKKKECHQYMYGGWLVQEAITMLRERGPANLPEEDIRAHLKYKYNTQLSFGCWHENKKYDLDCCYNFPDCLEQGGIQFGLKVVRNMQILHHLEKRREDGIVGKTMRDRGTAIYDYSSIL